MVESNHAARLASLLCQFPPPRAVLDLGCGNCPGFSFAAGPTRKTFVGVDYDSAALSRSRQHYPAALHLVQADLHLVQADAVHLPLRCQFDLILIRHPDIDQNRLRWQMVIQHAFNWLTEPGILVITVYSLSEFEDIRCWLAGHTPVPFDERRLVPASLDGRDRFIGVYQKPRARLSASV